MTVTPQVIIMILTIFHVGRGGREGATSRKLKHLKCSDAGVLIKRIRDWSYFFKFKKGIQRNVDLRMF